MSEHILDDLKTPGAFDPARLDAARSLMAEEYKRCGRRSFSLRERAELCDATEEEALAIMHAIVASGDASFSFGMNTQGGDCQWGADDLGSLLESVERGSIGLSKKPEEYNEFRIYGRRVYLDVRLLMSKAWTTRLDAEKTGWRLLNSDPYLDSFASRTYAPVGAEWPRLQISIMPFDEPDGASFWVQSRLQPYGLGWDDTSIPLTLLDDVIEMLVATKAKVPT